MPDIVVLLACLSQCVEPTPLRQLGRVIEAMLSMSGRVTMRGLARWSGKGGSYRTIQRFWLFAIIEARAKSRHTKPKCAFVYCIHFVDHTPSAGSA